MNKLDKDLLISIHGEELAAVFEARMLEFEALADHEFVPLADHERPEVVVRPPILTPPYSLPLFGRVDDHHHPKENDVPAASAPLMSWCNKDPPFPPAELIKKWERRGAASNARPFTCCCESGGLKQRYTCIWSGSVKSFTDVLTGFTWVAVHGMNSVCAATTTKDLEHELNLRKDLYDDEPDLTLQHFTNGLIGEVEGFVDPNKFPRHHLHLIMKKPFGVVSLAPDTKTVGTASGDEALNAEYDEENAIKFFKDEIESGTVFTYNKTVQAAICALNRLFRKEFQARDIVVFVVKEKDGGEAKALTNVEKQEHLAAMNNRDSCVHEEGFEDEEILEIKKEEELAAKKRHLTDYSNMKELGACRPLCMVHSTPPPVTWMSPN